VPKVSGTTLYNEFRPNNTVPVYEKVLELAVKKQLPDHWDINSLLVVNQSGFRESHSSESVVVNLCDIFKKEIDNGNYVLAVFWTLKEHLKRLIGGCCCASLSAWA